MNNSLSISQNFIIDPNLIAKILDSKCHIIKDDIVLDIGAGKGALTFELAKRCKQVIAYELDEKLYQDLDGEIKKRNTDNIKLVNTDFLQETHFPDKYKVFSNIPFSKSAEIVRKLLIDVNLVDECYLFLEKNTAYRFMGINGESMLSLNIAINYEHSFIWQFQKYDFRPRPNADIVLVLFKRRQEVLIEAYEIPEFVGFIDKIFKERKHDLKGALLTVFTFKQLQRIKRDLRIDLKAVPSSLKIEKWILLYKLAKSLDVIKR